MPRRGRGSQLIRLLTILNVVKEANSAPADYILRRVWDRLDLAPEDKFDKRTLYRDLKLLGDPRFAWVVHDKKRNTYSVAPEVREGLRLAATFDEGLAVLLARELLKPFAGTPAVEGLDALWNKFRPYFSDRQVALFDDWNARLLVKSSLAAAPDPHTVKLLFDAVARCYSVRLLYQPIYEDKPREGVYDPYGMVFREDALYLVAASHRWRQWRAKAFPDKPVAHFAGVVSLKMARISGVTLLSRGFERPSDLDLSSLFAETLGIFRDSATQEEATTYRLRLAPMAARLVAESPWHGSQTLAPKAGGGAVLTLKLASRAELLPKVLALGANAEALEPADFRRELADLYGELAERHRSYHREEPGKDV